MQNNTNKLVVVLLVGAVLIVGLFLVTRPKETNEEPVATAPEVTNITVPESTQTTDTTMAPKVVTVTVTPTGYMPASVSLKVGDKVVWVNKSGGAVTVSSDPHPTHTNYPPLNLGSFEDGASVELVFDQAGTYGYHNHFNASQKGTVTVTE